MPGGLYRVGPQYLVGISGNRPAANKVPPSTKYFETDTKREWRSDGAAWTQTSGLAGIELGYAEIVANFGPTAGVANTIYPVTGLSVAVQVGTRPIKVEAHIPSIIPSAVSPDISVQLYEDGAIVQASTQGGALQNKRYPMTLRSRRAPAQGQRTYDLRVKSSLAGTLLIEAGAAFPAFLSVTEL